VFDRGYTGHEHLDIFDLINMNGRVYDPWLGRFLSPDLYIQLPEYSQCYNRYSYCLNNSLKYIDPTGYTMLQTLIDWYAYEGGSFYYRGQYYYYNSEDQIFVNPNGQVANSGGYHYDWLNKVYKNGYGQSTPWTEVFYSYFNNNALILINTLVFAGSKSNPYKVLRGIGFSDGSEWYTEDGLCALNKYLTKTGIEYLPYLGIFGSISHEMYYSVKYGTWMGKNFRIYKQNLSGNGITGGKNKFAKTISNKIKWAGRILGIFNALLITHEYNQGELSTEQMIGEHITNLIAVEGGIEGAAWGIGWELGKVVTSLELYQQAKFNFWYNYVEKQIGPPSPLNEDLWFDFYQNYNR